MLDAEKALGKVWIKLFLCDGLPFVGVIIVTVDAEEISAVDLETPLRKGQRRKERDREIVMS